MVLQAGERVSPGAEPTGAAAREPQAGAVPVLPALATSTRRRRGATPVCAGVDVGGPRKGFHVVALQRHRIVATFAAQDPAAVAAWIRSMAAQVVAIDAPARWSLTGRARPAERALNRLGYRCFATPTEAVARAHPRGWYDWMLAGADLYAALAPTHPLYPTRGPSGAAAVETFPHAVAHALARRRPAAGTPKEAFRRRVLRTAGIEPRSLGSIDLVDAALAALAAQALARSAAVTVGDDAEGHIAIPTPRSRTGARRG